jgi:carbon-monoxide dehydrogenase large subunit
MSSERRPNAYIGASLPRREDLRLLRGKGQFVDDLALPGMLHAAILRSPYAHARLLRLDTSRALGSPGVHSVLTAGDIAPSPPSIPMRQEALEELRRFEQPVLAHERIRYAGEPVAVVLAGSRALAEDAAALIEIEVEPLSACLGSRDEGMPVAPLFDGCADNVAMRLRGLKGDADRAFATAPYVRSERFRVQRHSAFPMEPRGLLAVHDKASGHLTVHGAAKVPFAIRDVLSRQLDMPVEAITMIENDVGGGFGVRGEFYPEDFLIPFAAIRSGRPVKWCEDRLEAFLATNHAREMECELSIACTLDGEILGLRGEAICDLGAYMRTNAITQPRNVVQVISGPYRVPNVDLGAVLMMSNKTPAGTYRGPGRFEADFFRERLLDLSAKDLGIDRLAMRRRNLVTSAEMPYQLPRVLPYESGTECDSGDYAVTFERCLEEIGWHEQSHRQGLQPDGRYHGLGIGCYIESGASGPRENVRLALEKDGSITLYTGSCGVGQGIETVMAQIAADALELPIDRINTVLHGSTTYLERGYGTYGSRTVVMGGSAIVDAAGKLRDAILSAAANRMGCSGNEVRLLADRVAGPAASLTWSELGDLGLSAEGSYGSDKRTYSYGAHAARVAVDPGTGRVEVIDYVAIDDIGRAINPATLKGQVVGAIMQGLGGVLLEELHYGPEGQSLVGSFADYLFPTATDFPAIRTLTLELHPSPNNPLGAKGGGEGGMIPVAGVISNAVAAALSSFHAKPHVLPLTPDRIWRMTRVGA